MPAKKREPATHEQKTPDRSDGAEPFKGREGEEIKAATKEKESKEKEIERGFLKAWEMDEEKQEDCMGQVIERGGLPNLERLMFD